MDLRMERLRVEFFDIGAGIYFLRKVIWAVPTSRSTPTANNCANYTTASHLMAPSSPTPRGY